MSTYDDDRHGLMRIHIASERARLAKGLIPRPTLRAHAKKHGVTSGMSGDLAWEMAQNGLIDAKGNLRDGFPEAAS